MSAATVNGYKFSVSCSPLGSLVLCVSVRQDIVVWHDFFGSIGVTSKLLLLSSLAAFVD